MQKPLKKVILPVLVILLVLIILIFMVFLQKSPNSLPGYIEANLTYISPQVSGKLNKLSVHRGDKVVIGQPLFKLDSQYYQFALKSAEMNVQANQASYENLLTGERPPEIEQIIANIEQEAAKMEYLQQNFDRNKNLLAENLTSQQNYELSESQLLQAQAKLIQLEASLVTAQLPAREQKVINAKALTNSSAEQTKQAQWEVDQALVKSPVSATVFDTYYWPGEVVNANQPVVSLLVPDQIKLIFFITETELSRISLNKKVQFATDGNSKKMTARITYVSDKAEYTPPVIYSDSSRKDLVFRVEAKVEENNTWHSGQPVSVYLGSN
ncbi:MAG: HlyD family secretion protein [Francisellaceae bacterium]|jgi:HlyD family secretion protein